MYIHLVPPRLLELFFSVTFCQQRQKVTKERRRRRIFAKNLLTPLNSRGWRSPQSTPPSREFLTLRSKIFFTLICEVAAVAF